MSIRLRLHRLVRRFGVLFLVIASSLRAGTSDRDMVREAALEHQLEILQPALVAPFRDARIAMDRNDFVTAEPLLRQVVAAAPTFDPAVRRLGLAVLHNRDRAEGLRLIEHAIELQRSADNLSTLAYGLAFVDSEPLSDRDATRAKALLQEARQLPDGADLSTLAMIAQLALRDHEMGPARRAVADLRTRFPDAMSTHYFAAYVAANDEDWIAAEDEILRAEQLGLSHDVTQHFLDLGIHDHASTWRWVHRMSWTIVGWAIGLGALFGLGALLSTITLRQIDRSDPRVAIAPGEIRLRKLYRVVLNLAGFYYYISLPIVMLLVLGLAAALIYGFLAAGTIPIKLTALVVIGAVATLWSMARSLFVRVSGDDPGFALPKEDAAGLWALSDQVAADLGTRPIDEIRLTPGTDLCVYERGGWREKLRGTAPRILILGTGVLHGFKTADFRAVLAHEYGHFAHRDTAGGEVALRVQRDMVNFYVAMLRAGQATWTNVAFHFLRFYNFVFRRISHGATRLQEVLADRVAARHYGPAAFEGGLRHVIRQAVEFGFVADREISAALKSRAPIANLYTLTAPATTQLDRDVQEAITRPTSLDDTHPGPLDRFRLIAPLAEPAAPPPAGLVWDLFADPEKIMTRMMAQVEINVARHRT